MDHPLPLMFLKDLFPLPRLGDPGLVVRNLLKNKLVAFINGLGISVCITTCFTIFLLVIYELSIDTFSTDHDRIYHGYSNYGGILSGKMHSVQTVVSDQMRESFTGIEALANLFTW